MKTIGEPSDVPADICAPPITDRLDMAAYEAVWRE
jgi:hypothetical protein